MYLQGYLFFSLFFAASFASGNDQLPSGPTTQPSNFTPPSFSQISECISEYSEYTSTGFCQCVLEGTGKQNVCASPQFYLVQAALSCAAQDMLNATKVCTCFAKAVGEPTTMCGPATTMDGVMDLVVCAVNETGARNTCLCYVKKLEPTLSPEDVCAKAGDDVQNVTLPMACFNKFQDTNSSEYCMCVSRKWNNFVCEYGNTCTCTDAFNCDASCSLQAGFSALIVVTLTCCICFFVLVLFCCCCCCTWALLVKRNARRTITPSGMVSNWKYAAMPVQVVDMEMDPSPFSQTISHEH